MTSDGEVPGSDDIPVAVIVAVMDGLTRLPPTARLRRDPAYRDAMVPLALQPHLPPEWDPEERPSEPHRRGDCDAESAAGRTKKSKARRAEHCGCGSRRPLTPEGVPAGDWFDVNSAVIASPALDEDPAAAGGPGFWRRVLPTLRRRRSR